jgi:hypothetical protein
MLSLSDLSPPEEDLTGGGVQDLAVAIFSFELERVDLSDFRELDVS